MRHKKVHLTDIMTYIYFILLAIAACWLVKRIIDNKQRLNAEQEYRDREYADAVSAINNGDWELALSHLCLSIGRCPSFDAYNALGVVWERLERYDLAAEAFRHARNLAGYGPGSPYACSKDRIPNPEEVCQFFQQESLAHARDSNWKFAYLRSREALYLIREGQLPRYIEYGDCESWIRLIHMLAAVQFLEGAEGIYSAEEDANWILANSRVSGYEKLARIVIEGLIDLSKLRLRLLEEWREYDKTIGRKSPIISEPIRE